VDLSWTSGGLARHDAGAMRIALFANAGFPVPDGTVTILDGHLPGPADQLVPMLKELRDRFEAALVLFGDGGHEAALKEAAAHMGISERIQFAGVIRGPKELGRFYGDADVFVFVADGQLRGGQAGRSSSLAAAGSGRVSRQDGRDWGRG
jgi:hypothetical protein